MLWTTLLRISWLTNLRREDFWFSHIEQLVSLSILPSSSKTVSLKLSRGKFFNFTKKKEILAHKHLVRDAIKHLFIWIFNFVLISATKSIFCRFIEISIVNWASRLSFIRCRLPEIRKNAPIDSSLFLHHRFTFGLVNDDARKHTTTTTSSSISDRTSTSSYNFYFYYLIVEPNRNASEVFSFFSIRSFKSQQVRIAFNSKIF